MNTKIPAQRDHLKSILVWITVLVTLAAAACDQNDPLNPVHIGGTSTESDSTSKDTVPRSPETAPPLIENDFGVALSHAQSRQVPLIVEFSSPDCPHCKKMENTVYNQPEFADLTQHVVWVRINARAAEGPILAEQIGFRSTPSYAFVALDGSSTYFQYAGSLNPPAFFHLFDLMIPQQQSDGGNALDVIRTMLMRGNLEDAAAKLDSILHNDPDNHQGMTDDALTILGQLENCLEPGCTIAHDDWRHVIDRFPTSDRAADCAAYLMKWFKAAGDNEKAAALAPMVRGLPDNIDIRGIAAIVDQP